MWEASNKYKDMFMMCVTLEFDMESTGIIKSLHTGSRRRLISNQMCVNFAITIDANPADIRI